MICPPARAGSIRTPSRLIRSKDSFDTYLNSVGANTTFNLNVPPMPNGKLNDEDVKRLNELVELIKNSFKTNLV